MYKCPFCENLTYDWDDAWHIEKKNEVMKIVSEHIGTHPEAKPVFVGETVPENPVTPEEDMLKIH